MRETAKQHVLPRKSGAEGGVGSGGDGDAAGGSCGGGGIGGGSSGGGCCDSGSGDSTYSNYSEDGDYTYEEQ